MPTSGHHNFGFSLLAARFPFIAAGVYVGVNLRLIPSSEAGLVGKGGEWVWISRPCGS